jgi:hypothetical protein
MASTTTPAAHRDRFIILKKFIGLVFHKRA